MELQVIYDGPALDNHEMDLEQLRSSLEALSKLITESNTILYGKKPLRIKIRGGFQKGSLGFEVILEYWNATVDFLNSPSVNALSNLKDIASLPIAAVFGLVTLIKRLRGRKLHLIKDASGRIVAVVVDGKRFVERGKEGGVYLILDGKEQLAPDGSLALYESRKVREALSTLVAPTKQEGIDSLTLKLQDGDYSQVTKQEATQFDLPKDEEEVDGDIVFDATIKVIKAHFKEGSVWLWRMTSSMCLM